MSRPSRPPLHPVPNSGMVRRIVSLVTAATIVSTLAVGAVGTLAVVASLERRIGEAYPAVLQSSAASTLHHLEDAQQAIALVAGEPTLRSAIAGAATRRTPGAGRPEFLDLLSGLLLRSGPFASLVALDPEGHVLGSVGSGPELEALLRVLEPGGTLESDLADRMQAVELRKQLTAADKRPLTFWATRETPPLPLASASVRDASGRAVGTIHGFLRRDDLAGCLHAGALGGANVLLVSAERGIVASALPLGRDSLGKVAEPLVAAADAEPLVRRGVGSLTAAHAVGEHGLVIAIEQPILSAYAPALMAAAGFGGAGLLMLMLFPLIAARSGYNLIQPLRLLYGGLRAVVRDNLPDENLPLRRTVGESESLVLAFNVMADRIRAQRNESEMSRRALQEQNQAFQQHQKSLQKLSVTDELTQLHNHRFFQDHLGREIKRLSRTGEGLALLLIDIDYFKKLNDNFGHAAGDEFLRQIARILKEMVRETDLLARYGGEEFAIICTGTTIEGAMVLAEKIRTAIAESSFIVDETMRPRRATVSIGVAEYRGNRTDLFNSADAALYRAKDGGRNCVMLAEDGDLLDANA